MLSQPVLLLSVILRTHIQQGQIAQIQLCQCHHIFKALFNAESSVCIGVCGSVAMLQNPPVRESQNSLTSYDCIRGQVQLWGIQ